MISPGTQPIHPPGTAAVNGPSRLPGWVQSLLRVPLLYKIVVANGAIVLVTALTVVALTLWLDTRFTGLSPLGLAVFAAFLALLPTLLLNTAIVATALSPLRDMEDTAQRVQEGELDARTPSSPFADRRQRRLTRALNGMLERLEEQRVQQREMMAMVLEAEEVERGRISEELLADPAQVLSFLLLQLRIAERAATAPARGEAVVRLREGLVDALHGVRRIARGLRPPELDELGLVSALEALGRSVGERTGISVKIDARTLDRSRVSPEVALTAYRVVQEGLANALRHAASEEVRVILRCDGERLRITVRDEGVGFDAEALLAGQERPVGLARMMERASRADGDLVIRSAPGSGTTLELQLPLPAR